MLSDPEILLQPIAITSIILLLAALSVLIFLRKPRTKRTGPSSDHVFTFEHRELVAASTAARDALNIEDLDEDIYNQMIYRLSDVFQNLPDQIEVFEAGGPDFVLKEVSIEGPMSISVARESQKTIVTITGMPAPLSRKVIVDRDQAIATESELKTLRGTVETAPFPMWRENGSGTIDWVNRAYLSLLENTEQGDDSRTWPPMRLFESGTVVKMGDTPVPSRKVIKDRNGVANWFDITAIGIGENSLHFAVNANATARAEESQRNFLQTLTQTFSYLPTGLAIFDRSRQLVLFNPSLTDLTGLEPQWLILKPTLYDFLNHLREKRILPERKDFKDWRGKISALERSVKEGTYSETWTLPTGQTYRMTGRPHPEGAIAFLFEDISAEISLTRKFRRELDLNQAIFDNLSEAIAIFAQDGELTMANEAYSDLWGFDDTNPLAQLNIIEASQHWQAEAHPTPIWGDAREFVMSAGERSEWFENIWLQDGRQLRCRFSPLAGGSTLVAFDEISMPFTMPELRMNPDRRELSNPVPASEKRAKSA